MFLSNFLYKTKKEKKETDNLVILKHVWNRSKIIKIFDKSTFGDLTQNLHNLPLGGPVGDRQNDNLNDASFTSKIIAKYSILNCEVWSFFHPSKLKDFKADLL